jgi:hypothetical protein
MEDIRRIKMKRHVLSCLAVAALAGLAACSDNNSTPIGTGYFKVANGVTDSTSMNFEIGNVGDGGSVPFGDASGNVTVPQGSYDATIKPTSDTGKDYKVTGVPIDGDKVSTVVTYGSVAGGTASGFKAEESIDDPSSSSKFAVQFLHGASALQAGALNFYLVEPGSTVDATTPVTVNFATASPDRVEYAISSSGTYELVIKSAAGVLLYDSGASAQLLKEGANVLQIAALDASSSTSGISPLAVVVMDNKGGHFPLPAASAQ